MKLTLFVLVTILATTCASSRVNSDLKSLEKSLNSGKDVFVENETFEETIDFTSMLSSNPVSDGMKQVRIASSVTFRNCTFTGDVIAFTDDGEGNRIYTTFQSNVSFINCTFKGKVHFRACSVGGRALFTGSYFEKETNFEECSFMQNAYFNRSVFHEELRFQNAFFMQRITFIDAEFDANASFQGVTFNATAQFSNTKYAAYADFSMVSWNGPCFFNYAKFPERSVFNNSFFAKTAEFISVGFGHTEMMHCRFYGGASFMNATIETQLLLDDCFFLLEQPDLSFFDQDKLSLKGIN